MEYIDIDGVMSVFDDFSDKGVQDMKKMSLSIKINVPDDFICGDCKKCPIHQKSYFSTHQYEDTKISCPLGYQGYSSINCPLEPQTESEE